MREYRTVTVWPAGMAEIRGHIAAALRATRNPATARDARQFLRFAVRTAITDPAAAPYFRDDAEGWRILALMHREALC